MHVFLEEEKQHLLQDLRQEEELTAARLQQREDALAQQCHTLEILLLHLEEQGQRGPLHMLQVWLLLSWPGRAGEVWLTNWERMLPKSPEGSNKTFIVSQS